VQPSPEACDGTEVVFCQAARRLRRLREDRLTCAVTKGRADCSNATAKQAAAIGPKGPAKEP
jgi:hypothetical protein